MSATTTTPEIHSLTTNEFVNLPDALESIKRQMSKWLDNARETSPEITIASQSHAVHKSHRGHVVSVLFTVA